MSEFKPIETQEELNNVIGERLRRNEEKVRESFKDYKSPDEVADLQKNFETELTKLKTASEAWTTEKAGLEDQLKQAQGQVAEAKLESLRMTIASEMGIPAGLAKRITGTDEESIRADASELAKYTTNISSTPLATTEVDEGDSTDAALRKLANDLKFD